MSGKFKTALAALIVATVSLPVAAAPQAPLGEPLNANDIRKAEKNARTAEDHLRLAAWYESEARQAQNRLTEEEQLVAYYWAGQPEMVTRTKIPNPYWSAQALARSYREELGRATKLAATHRKLAESLEARAG
jgi:hypothetical protein